MIWPKDSRSSRGRHRGVPADAATSVASQTGDASATQGGVAVSGIVQGPITVNTAVPARSAYAYQVRRITPQVLENRAAELDELARFCVAEDGTYSWWRAPAWAGKTALMSWFVLHPPPEVSLVAFFVTARWAGQGDRAAFADVVIEQLAEILGEPMPTYLSDANRDTTLLHFMTEAARKCQEAGRRLVLVVDGLDEDMGVTSGGDVHSIAALLPAQPPFGMKVIVAGRPHPPIPEDVPEGHPLRDESIVRTLWQVPAAKVLQLEAERDLKRLLRGLESEQDLLGFLVASGGGLSSDDLSVLTGAAEWQIAEHLRSVSARAFSARTSQWHPDRGPDLYVLAHEELHRTATRFLGQKRIAGYRQKLHMWAAGYRDQGWPSETPEYLLTGYPSILLDEPDASQLVALATDIRRHWRLLEQSGSDNAALMELTSTQRLVCRGASPDLTALGRLAIHKDLILQSNSNIPPQLPGFWAAAGEMARAEGLATSLPDTNTRTSAMTEVVHVAVTMQQFDVAERLASGIPDAAKQHAAYAAIATAAVAAGDQARAERLAAAIPGLAIEQPSETPDQEQTLTRPRLQDAILGRPYDTGIGAPDDEESASIGPGKAGAEQPKPDPYAERAKAAILRGELDEALTAALFIANPYEQDLLKGEVSDAATRRGNFALAQSAVRSMHSEYSRAAAVKPLIEELLRRRDIDQAAQIAQSLLNTIHKWDALEKLARTVAADGDLARAAAFLEQADTHNWYDHDHAVLRILEAAPSSTLLEDGAAIAQSLRGAATRAEALLLVVKAAMTADNPDLVLSLAHEVVEAARSVEYLPARVKLTVELITVTKTPMDPNLLAAFVEADGNASSGSSAISKMNSLLAFALALLDAGDTAGAKSLAERAQLHARSAPDPEWQARVLREVAAAAVAIDHLERAEDAIFGITEPIVLVKVLLSLIRANVARGDVANVTALARAGIEIAQTVDDRCWQVGTPFTLIQAAVENGNAARALITAECLEDATAATVASEWHAEALCEIARRRAEAGDLDYARIALETSVAVAEDLSNSARRVSALTEIVWSAIEIQDLARAELVARSITDHDARSIALVRVAEAFARTGEHTRAEEVLRAISVSDRRLDAQIAVVRIIAAGGDFDRAERIAATIDSKIGKAQALLAIVWAAAIQGDLIRADAIAASIDDMEYRRWAYRDVAKTREKLRPPPDPSLSSEMPGPLHRSSLNIESTSILPARKDASPVEHPTTARALVAARLCSDGFLVQARALALIDQDAFGIAVDELLAQLSVKRRHPRSGEPDEDVPETRS